MFHSACNASIGGIHMAFMAGYKPKPNQDGSLDDPTINVMLRDVVPAEV